MCETCDARRMAARIVLNSFGYPARDFTDDEIDFACRRLQDKMTCGCHNALLVRASFVELISEFCETLFSKQSTPGATRSGGEA